MNIKGKLIVLGTPIGNLKDFSPRGVETLKECDFIAAEDTRVTKKLLNHFKIQKTTVSFFEYTSSKKLNAIVKRILNGENCTLVSDAGMPTIQDPGQDLVDECIKNNIKIEVVPGPTAFASAIAVSGMPCARFVFEGFLNTNEKTKEIYVKTLENEKRTMIFYEAPHRLVKTLKCFLKIFGNRTLSISREITKIYEENKRTNVEEAILYWENNTPRGEFVLVVEGKKDKDDERLTKEEAVQIAKNFLLKGAGINESSKNASKQTGIKKGDIYKELLNDFEVSKIF